MMRAISLTLAFAACATTGSTPGQGPEPDVQSPSAHVDTTFITERDVSRPVLISCPTLPRSVNRGIVELSMIIDTLGRPEPGSLKVVSSTDVSLSNTALRIAPLCRFKPGSYRGHALRLRVQVPLNF